jgi:tRNA-modifying protein YgfZ
MGEAAADRRVMSLTGADVLPFLQGLVTNDVLPLAKGPGLVWTALLTPQGKYLADFFVANTGTGLILDLPEVLADSTLRRLSMYRLRADVQMGPSPLHVQRGLGPGPAGALRDPRDPGLGWRAYMEEPGSAAVIDWTALRVAACVPETGVELIPDETYILEAGFERLHGVDFRKGCYVGQEVTARMKHKTDLRKGLVRVAVTGHAPPGTPIIAGGKEAGILFSQSGDRAIAWLRHDRIVPVMQAGDAEVRPADPV